MFHLHKAQQYSLKTARPSWLPSTMLIQVALLVFFQSKEERRLGRVEERRERGSGRRIGLNLSWLAIQCRQIANLLLSAGGRSEGYRGIRRGDRIGSLKSHKKVTDRRHREKRDPDCAHPVSAANECNNRFASSGMALQLTLTKQSIRR